MRLRSQSQQRGKYSLSQASAVSNYNDCSQQWGRDREWSSGPLSQDVCPLPLSGSQTCLASAVHRMSHGDDKPQPRLPFLGNQYAMYHDVHVVGLLPTTTTLELLSPDAEAHT